MDADPVTEPMEAPDYLAEVARLGALLRGAGPAGSEDEALARITALEELTGTIAAAQSAEAVAFAQLRRDRDRLNGLPVRDRGVRAGDEVGLAKRVSPGSGRKFLATAEAIVTQLPGTFSALSHGEISAEKARIMVDETATLDPGARRLVDTRMRQSLGQSGPRSLRSEVRAMAMQVDAEAAATKAEAAAEKRRVSLTPLADGMGRVSAILPMPEALAVWTGLKEAADSRVAAGEAEGRRHPQVMADTFVERLTGQAAAAAVPTQVHVLVDAESLFSDGRVPAWLPGCGPLPAKTARRFLAANEAEVFIRRMFTSVGEGQLVGAESKSRVFTGRLREMVIFRDDQCRTPWCDAPIKHADHAQPHARGGATSWENGSGLCASCNYAKEHPGWSHEARAEGLTVTTPSGRSYATTTPPLVRRMKYPRRAVPGIGSPGADVPGAGLPGTGPPDSDWRQFFAGFLEPDPGPDPPGSSDESLGGRSEAPGGASVAPAQRRAEPPPSESLGAIAPDELSSDEYPPSEPDMSDSSAGSADEPCAESAPIECGSRMILPWRGRSRSRSTMSMLSMPEELLAARILAGAAGAASEGS